jgi:hypothetical protein
MVGLFPYLLTLLIALKVLYLWLQFFLFNFGFILLEEVVVKRSQGQVQ